jgi:hypothetical protein
MQLSKPVPGTDYTVNVVSVQDMRDMMKAQDDASQMAMFAQLATRNADGVNVWATLEQALAAPWPLVHKCAIAAMELNGMGAEGEDSGN